MKGTKIVQETTTIDQKYINSVYDKLVDKIKILDKLSSEFKVKQQYHFLTTFMKVIDKIGSELIKAQQAYKNVDREIKKDTYCVELAEQLHFFRDQSYNLKESLQKIKEELKETKVLKNNIEHELECIQELYQQKLKENLQLKDEVKRLKKQFKGFNRLDLLSRKNHLQQRKQKEFSPQNNSLTGFTQHFRSHVLTIPKSEVSYAFQTCIPSNKNQNISQSTSIGTPKAVFSRRKSVSSANDTLLKRRRLPSHLRILPQEYIPLSK